MSNSLKSTESYRCCTCFTIVNVFQKLDENVPESGDNKQFKGSVTLSQMLVSLVPQTMQRAGIICKICVPQLISSYRFQQMCLLSYEKLLKTAININKRIINKVSKDPLENNQTHTQINTIIEKGVNEQLSVENYSTKDESDIDIMSSNSELIAYSAKELSCSLCDKTFDGQLFLKQHLLNEHLQTQTTKNGDGGRQSDNSINTGTEEIEKPNSNNRRNGCFPCSHCGKKFDRLYRLKRHSSVHLEKLPKSNKNLHHSLKIEETQLRDSKVDDKISIITFTPEPLKSNTGGFKCPDCPRRFEKQTSMAAHSQTHSRILTEANYPCNRCEMKFVSIHLLTDHLTLQHPEAEQFQCNQCERSFILHALLLEHLNRHKGSRNLVCVICEKEFGYSNTLKEHMRTHSGESPYLCPKCGKTFRSASNLRQHMERHGEERRYQCPECPSRFACQSDRIKHMSIHKGVKPHICDICGSRFTRSYSLAKHKQLHTGERPFKCEHCGMTFTINYHLRRHMRTHTGEKPYKCQYCNRAYAESGDLTKHLRQHIGENTYKCEQCPQAFKYLTELRQHQSEHYKQKQQQKQAWEQDKEGNVIMKEMEVNKMDKDNTNITLDPLKKIKDSILHK